MKPTPAMLSAIRELSKCHEPALASDVSCSIRTLRRLVRLGYAKVRVPPHRPGETCRDLMRSAERFELNTRGRLLAKAG